MKQKLLFALALFVASISPSQLKAEEITAPEEPTWSATPVAPESGKVYYLYDVTQDKYWGPNNGNYCGTPTALDKARAFLLENGTYGWSIKDASNGASVGIRGSYIYENNHYSDEYYYFTITESSVSGEYNIQSPETSPYSALYYLRMGSAELTFNSIEKDHWQFIDANVRERYLASLQLYNAIVLAQGKNLYTPNYEKIYNERDSHTIGELYATAAELNTAINITTSSDVLAASNEYPIILSSTSGTWKYSSSSKAEYSNVKAGESSSIKAKFYVDNDAIFTYFAKTDNDGNAMQLYVYVDGKEVRALNKGREAYTKSRYCEPVAAGEHTVELKFENRTSGTSSYNGYLSDFSIHAAPLITVSLLEPGSLGTEVLYNVDGLKDVKNLKVIGKMNGDDWAKIAMMDYLFALDLSEAIIDNVPAKALSAQYDDSFSRLYKVVLPEGVEEIGEDAFQGSPLESVNIPSTVSTIGGDAFYETNLKQIVLPNSVNSIGTYSFYGCNHLRDVTLSSSLTKIPDYAFAYCRALMNCPLPEGITSIGNYAFRHDYNLQQTFPESLTSIRENAYENCDKLCAGTEGVLTIPLNVKSIGYEAFYDSDDIVKLIIKGANSIECEAFRSCDNLQEIDLPTAYYTINTTGGNYRIFEYCNNINKITLRCPTVITHPKTLGCDLSKVDLYVPDFAVNQYKLDSYWYNYKTINGFSTSEVTDWEINNPLVLDSHGRFEGTPNITIKADKSRMPSLKINGDASMTINNLYFGGYRESATYAYPNYPGQILSNCSNISVTGQVKTALHTCKNRWYFFSLPFDVKISEITHDVEGVQMAIRYYDGANRAENGPTGSWKNFEEDAVIPAGTGFIMQTNVETWNYFFAMDNASKQNCISNKDFVKTLDVNDSETESNKGWNLVGNPWQCYFNDHSLNFTAPITVWDSYNRTYIAYSITDDDYAIRPNEAFFVQCPGEDYATIGFPVQGRQLNDVIETQNAVKAFAPQAAARKLVNLTLTNGEQKDQTRVVLNEKASLGYETICDASKFLSMDASVPQLYSLDMDGTQYAINERPMSEGSVKLGFMAPADGNYTIALGRCDLENVYLKDNKTNETIALTEDGYTFEAEAGVDDERFTLCFNAGEATGIEKTEMTDEGNKAVYSIDGKYVGTEPKKLDNGVYIIRKGKNTSKVVVR